MAQRGVVPILIIIFIAVVALGGGYLVYQTQILKPTPQPSPVACTLEAKLCPDGSSVGRTGPNCEFAPCPTPKESTSSADTSIWKTYKNREYDYEIKYPSILKMKESNGDNYEGYYSKSFEVNLQNYPSEEEYKHPDAISIMIRTMKPETKIANLQKWLENQSIGPRVDGTTGLLFRDFTKYKFSNIEALIYYDLQESVRKNVAFYMNGLVFIFSLDPTTETGGRYDENKEAVKIFDQILSTFKFLNQNASDQSDGNCQPRPACLDAITTPRCLMPEPAGGWCP